MAADRRRLNSTAQGEKVPVFGDHRVMGCTRADLVRWLGEMVPGGVVEVPGGFRVESGGLDLTIEIAPVPPRRIGLVTIEGLDIRFSYPQEQREAARAWIASFDAHTYRGGG